MSLALLVVGVIVVGRDTIGATKMSCSPFSDLTFTIKATSWIREHD
jgi:hypothetical protein